MLPMPCVHKMWELCDVYKGSGGGALSSFHASSFYSWPTSSSICTSRSSPVPSHPAFRASTLHSIKENLASFALLLASSSPEHSEHFQTELFYSIRKESHSRIRSTNRGLIYKYYRSINTTIIYEYYKTPLSF